ncbi:hypothetical protein HYH02_013209 [Chlamydomonas schloesseri]|uniref:Glycosyltransferase family 92 protein n=1 Tax=Chlamydomonas schloesseri TaxID=2026947 RepID=A0A835SQU3_9CHLO|nr:hypothetical protein HYH02_013209 [Chlamydomonas schloesseri]|eukprot:KAG2431632.1 hypothetical protein HYH02_013209 [Chlamydomonas schloesseri]
MARGFANWHLLALAVLIAASYFSTVTLAVRLGFHKPGYLAACLLTRDGNRDVREWIEYHLFAGVEKVFVIDHNSTVPVIDELTDYVVAGKVQYTYLTSEVPRISKGEDFPEGFQGRIFGECFEQARGYYKWMMFTDLDELMYVMHPQYGNSIPAVLREYEHAGAVLVHRRDVGSGGVAERTSDQGVMATFTKCTGRISEHVKGIAQLDYAAVSINAHCFDYKEGRTGVRLGDNRTVTRAATISDPPVDPPLLIYHYAGSVAEYMARSVKQEGGVSGMTKKDTGMYIRLDQFAVHDCLAGQAAHAAMAAAGAFRPLPDRPCDDLSGLPPHEAERRRQLRKGRRAHRHDRSSMSRRLSNEAAAAAARRMLR